MRIVSICPSNTEILHYMGLGEQIVGIDDHSDWPQELQHLPRVGPDLQIQIEKVMELQPDLVVASLSVPGMEQNIEQLLHHNIPHIVLNPSSVYDIADDIRTVGRATGNENNALKLAATFSNRLEAIRSLTKNITDRPRLYWEWWPNPIYTPGKKNWLTDISELAGAVNIFADYDTDNVKATREMVSERNPDHICVVWCGIQLKRIKRTMITERSEWQSIEAIQNDNVHILEEGLYCRPSPRILEGLEQLIDLIHPQLHQSTGKRDVD
ncbi:cobalamin-binding protein [Brevibacillus sp. SYSU BS000544]|uniref:cobalamin-binding protein n=1 Tax=Brevibacillus sp. SYSU BS000544 TaxID=3416443 RepID=UPI003CE52535